MRGTKSEVRHHPRLGKAGTVIAGLDIVSYGLEFRPRQQQKRTHRLLKAREREREQLNETKFPSPPNRTTRTLTSSTLFAPDIIFTIVIILIKVLLTTKSVFFIVYPVTAV